MKRFITALSLAALSCASQPIVKTTSPLHTKPYELQYKGYHVTITDFEMRGKSFREVEMDSHNQDPSHIMAVDKGINGTYEIFQVTEDHYTCTSPSQHDRCPGDVIKTARSLVDGAVELNMQQRSSPHVHDRTQQ